MGISTNCDAWDCCFSKSNLTHNVKSLLTNYNHKRRMFAFDSNHKLNSASNYVEWSRKLYRDVKQNVNLQYDNNNLRLSLYRPFTKRWLYYDNERQDNAFLNRAKITLVNILLIS